MKFESKSPDVHVAFIPCLARRWDGKPIKKQMAVRAIRERSGGWRVDKTSAVAGAWMPWEAINTTAYKSLTAAKTELRSIARACMIEPGFLGASRRRRRR